MRILSWNLWWRYGPWEQRREAIAATLAEIGPDVCGLQEVWGAAGENQAADHLLFHHVVPARQQQPYPFGSLGVVTHRCGASFAQKDGRGAAGSPVGGRWLLALQVQVWLAALDPCWQQDRRPRTPGPDQVCPRRGSAA